LDTIEAEVSKQCNALPRGEFASKALSHSFTVFAKDMVEVISFLLPVMFYTSSICVASASPFYCDLNSYSSN